MIISVCKSWATCTVPDHNGEIKMLPFMLNNIKDVPEKFRELVGLMIAALPFRKGTAYLTVDGRVVKEGTTHRRGGPHIDGNYIQESNVWGGTSDWKVGGDGKSLSPEVHKLSYQSKTGGMLIVSNYPACKGWVGAFDDEPKEGGDCSHLKLGEGFILAPNKIYYGNSQFVHESRPIEETTHRTIVRITLPLDYPIVPKLRLCY